MSELLPIKKIFNFEKGSLQSTKCAPGAFTFVTAGVDWKTHNEFTHDTEALILAVAASGSLGRCHYIKDKFIASDLCFILTPRDSTIYPVDLEFYHQIFRSIKSDLVQKTATGTSKLSINRTNFGNYKIPYFDIEHQKTFKKILLNVNEKKDRLLVCSDNQENLVNILRNQILQDAISGKLTAGWRARNPDIEPASKLLEKIKAEKEKMIAEKKIKKEKPLPKIAEDEIPFELPEKWEWCRLEELSNLIHYGATKSAKNNIKEVKLLRITDIQDNSVNWDSVPGCDYTKKDILNYGLSENDILIARTGGTIGKSYLVKNIHVKSLFASYLIRVIPNINIDAEYLKIAIESPLYWKQLYVAAWGAGQPNVSGTKLKALHIPLPPHAEQKAIVVKIEKLMEHVSKLEEKINQNKQDAEMLMQSFLAEAFQQ